MMVCYLEELFYNIYYRTKAFCTEFVENPMKAGDEVMSDSRANNLQDNDVCIKVCYFFYVKLFAHDLPICLLSIKVEFRGI